MLFKASVALAVGGGEQCQRNRRQRSKYDHEPGKKVERLKQMISLSNECLNTGRVAPTARNELYRPVRERPMC